jgi:hypothetical protein
MDWIVGAQLGKVKHARLFQQCACFLNTFDYFFQSQHVLHAGMVVGWIRVRLFNIAHPQRPSQNCWRPWSSLGWRTRKSRADGILRYGPVKVECTHERVACRDCGAKLSPGRRPT